MPEADTRIGSGSDFQDEALAVERAFAIRVAYDGTRSAFLSVLAEDSVVCGNGPERGRAVYEAMPQDHPGSLIWEISSNVVASDGTLACMTGPYRQLDAAGAKLGAGAYFSVWRRSSGSGRLQLVLDFWSRGAVSPGGDLGRMHQVGEGKPAFGMKPFLQSCVQDGRLPSTAGALAIGPEAGVDGLKPEGIFHSRDGELGVLWGPRARTDGTLGAFALLLGSGDPGPRPLLFINA